MVTCEAVVRAVAAGGWRAVCLCCADPTCTYPRCRELYRLLQGLPETRVTRGQPDVATDLAIVVEGCPASEMPRRKGVATLLLENS